MSSLIYDNPFLLSELLKYGQDGNWYAQNKQNFTTLHQMIQNLKTQPAENEVSHESEGDVSIRGENLQSLGALANFLLTNKITIGGRRIVYSEGENPHTEDYVPYRLEQGGTLAAMENEDRSARTATFVINKDLLSAYLVSLQSLLQKHPNRAMEVELGARIRESNDLLETTVSERYQDSKQKGQQQQRQTGGSGNAGVNMAILEELASAQVFNSQYIDFAMISDFVDKYAAWASNAASNTANANNAAVIQKWSGNVIALKNQIDTSMGLANEVLGGPGPIQLNNMTTAKFQLLTKNGNQAKLLASFLYTIISYAGRMCQDLIRILERGSRDARSLKQQLAPGGPQQSNISILNKMIQLL